MRQPRYPRVAGIQKGIPPRRLGEWIIAPVKIAHRIAIFTIRLSAPERLDIRMLIRGNRLRRQLAANPIGLFRQHHPHAVAQRPQRSRAASHARADDGHVAFEFPRGGQRKRRGQHAGQKFPAVQIALLLLF